MVGLTSTEEAKISVKAYSVLIRTSHKNILEISDFFQTLFEGNFRQFSDRTMDIFRLWNVLFIKLIKKSSDHYKFMNTCLKTAHNLPKCKKAEHLLPPKTHDFKKFCWESGISTLNFHQNIKISGKIWNFRLFSDHYHQIVWNSDFGRNFGPAYQHCLFLTHAII